MKNYFLLTAALACGLFAAPALFSHRPQSRGARSCRMGWYQPRAWRAAGRRLVTWPPPAGSARHARPGPPNNAGREKLTPTCKQPACPNRCMTEESANFSLINVFGDRAANGYATHNGMCFPVIDRSGYSVVVVCHL